MGAAAVLKAIFSPQGRMIAGALIAVMALGYAYHQGKEAAGAAALRAQIEALQRDLDIAEDARLAAERLAADAERRAAELDERLSAYEASLGDTPPVCLLDDRDVDGLRSLTR